MDPRPIWLIVALGVGGCGAPSVELDGSAPADGGPRLDASHSADAGRDAAMEIDAGSDDAARDAGSSDGGADDAAWPDDAGADAGADAGPPDAGRGVFDVRVLADPACADLSFDPPSISVPEGTSFTVNWINATGCTEIDIDKSGTVPIVIGLEPGTSYHDTVREWCGPLFTGTFSFRAYYAPSFPYYLDVDCSG